MLRANNFNVQPVVRTILMSEAMFSSAARNNRVKDPITLTVGFTRNTGIPFSINRLHDQLNDNGIGLELANPPDVSGWPMNRYKEAHESDYFLGWSYQRANYVVEVFEELDDWESSSPGPGQQPEGYYMQQILDQIGVALPSGAQVVDHLARIMDVTLTDFEREGLLFYMDYYYDESDDEFDPELFDSRVQSQVRRKVAGVLWLLSQHEDYQRY